MIDEVAVNQFKGLQDFIRRLSGRVPKTISVHTFETADVERCEVVKDILALYDD